MSTHALTKALALRSTGTVTALCVQVGMYPPFAGLEPFCSTPCKPANLEAKA